MRVVDGLALGFRAAAGMPAGLLVMAGWGAAEALWLPIIPDFVLGVLAFTNPGAWPWLVAATVAGSMAGGLAAYDLGRRGLVPPLPLTTRRMAVAADGWLAGGVARGVWHQPLSGVPFKVFAYRAAAGGVGLWPFLAVAGLARGARMLVVGALAATAGWAVQAHEPADAVVSGRLDVAVLALGTALFAAGFARVTRRWS